MMRLVSVVVCLFLIIAVVAARSESGAWGPRAHPADGERAAGWVARQGRHGHHHHARHGRHHLRKIIGGGEESAAWLPPPAEWENGEESGAWLPPMNWESGEESGAWGPRPWGPRPWGPRGGLEHLRRFCRFLWRSHHHRHFGFEDAEESSEESWTPISEEDVVEAFGAEESGAFADVWNWEDAIGAEESSWGHHGHHGHRHHGRRHWRHVCKRLWRRDHHHRHHHGWEDGEESGAWGPRPWGPPPMDWESGEESGAWGGHHHRHHHDWENSEESEESSESTINIRPIIVISEESSEESIESEMADVKKAAHSSSSGLGSGSIAVIAVAAVCVVALSVFAVIRRSRRVPEHYQPLSA